MNIVRFDPWREFDQLLGRAGVRQSARWVPALDVSESETEYRLDFELPGVAQEDLDVSVEKGVLKIAGERKAPESETHRSLRQERRYGEFQRSLRLPENVAEDDIKASWRDGVLQIVLLKAEANLPRRIEIEAA